MNFKELHEGAEPSMPGAPSGIKIMTPQQFVADAGDEKSDEEVAEGLDPNKEAAKTLQNLKNLALMKSALTSQQLRQAGRESMLTDAINACIQYEQSYLQNKQQGNAIFVRALRDEIDNFRKGYPINSSMPEDNAPELGDLLQGKLGKLNFQQSVAEDAHGSEAFQDIVQRANGDVRGIYKELQERGLHSEIKEFCLWARHHGIADINDAMKLAYKVDLAADEENEIAGEGYFQVKELLGLGRKGVAEGEKDTSRMNQQHQDFYNKNPNFKRDDREATSVGGRLATKVTPKTAQVTKKPMTPFEGKIDFAKKLQGKVDKHNKAVVQTRQAVGSRVADIGPGGKEYNVKTDAAWDAAKKKVSEGYKKK